MTCAIFTAQYEKATNESVNAIYQKGDLTHYVA